MLESFNILKYLYLMLLFSVVVLHGVMLYLSNTWLNKTLCCKLDDTRQRVVSWYAMHTSEL